MTENFPTKPTLIESAELTLIAKDPGEMALAQSGMIQWCESRGALARTEIAEAEEALVLASEGGWAPAAWQRRLRLATKKLRFYDKIKAALEAGYYIVPPFPLDIFAIRTDRHMPVAHESDYERARRTQEPRDLPVGPVCPHCDNPEKKPQYDLGKTRPGLRKCGACRKQYTARVGTIFEDSHIPLGSWLVALHRMCSSKKGIGAAQLQRELGLSYKSAWFMCHRIRAAMQHPPLAAKLGGAGTSGIVEVDETYIGGVPRNNPHKDHERKPKAIVLTLVERDGEARAFPIPATSKGLMQWPVRQNVEGTAHIVTDGHVSYHGLDQHFASHGTVDHGKEYVRGILHINFAESYHSLLKRGIVGTFHHISEQHLPKYLSEFSFRWNTRKVTDAERTERATALVKGVRMTYRALKANRK